MPINVLTHRQLPFESTELLGQNAQPPSHFAQFDGSEHFRRYLPYWLTYHAVPLADADGIHIRQLVFLPLY